MHNIIHRLPSVLVKTGLGRTTLYLHIKQGLFTPPIRLGERAVGWPASEVDAINTARIAGKTKEEIKVLVADLKVARRMVVGG